jgi:hypothetical protein
MGHLGQLDAVSPCVTRGQHSTLTQEVGGSNPLSRPNPHAPPPIERLHVCPGFGRSERLRERGFKRVRAPARRLGRRAPGMASSSIRDRCSACRARRISCADPERERLAKYPGSGFGYFGVPERAKGTECGAPLETVQTRILSLAPTYPILQQAFTTMPASTESEVREAPGYVVRAPWTKSRMRTRLRNGEVRTPTDALPTPP